MRSRIGGVPLLLAGGMVSLPFLVPLHAEPIRSFYSEWLAGLFGLVALVAAIVQSRSPVRMPRFAMVLLAFALVLLGNASSGMGAYPQMPLWGAGYVIYASLMLWLGTILVADHGLETSAEVLARFVVAASLLNALAGLIQWVGIPGVLSDFVAELPRGRAYGNIAQANLFANFLAVGGAGLIFFWSRLSISTPIGLALGCLLAASGALSGSRAALVYPAYFVALALWFSHKNLENQELRRVVRASLMLFAVVLLAHGIAALLSDSANDGTSFNRSGESLTSRWEVWREAWQIFLRAPWFGVGMGEFPGALFDSASGALSDGSLVWSSPHNLILHLLSETGVAGAVMVVLALIMWAIQAVRRVSDQPSAAQWWLVALAGVELLHSLWEFPLWSAHFLGLCAIAMGMSVASPVSSFVTIGIRTAGLAACGVLLAVLVWTMNDFWRLDDVRVTGTSRALPRPWSGGDARELVRLGQGPLGPVADYWRCEGTVPNRGNLDESLALTARVMRFRPSADVAARRALALMTEGRLTEANALVAKISQSPISVRAALSVFGDSKSSESQALLRHLIGNAK